MTNNDTESSATAYLDNRCTRCGGPFFRDRLSSGSRSRPRLLVKVWVASHQKAPTSRPYDDVAQCSVLQFLQWPSSSQQHGALGFVVRSSVCLSRVSKTVESKGFWLTPRTTVTVTLLNWVTFIRGIFARKGARRLFSVQF